MDDLPKWKKGKSFERDEGSKAHSKGGRVRKHTTTLEMRWGLKGMLNKKWGLKGALKMR